MSWREALAPRPMSRIAIVAPTSALRPALVQVADAGTVELDRFEAIDGTSAQPARLAATAPDLGALAGAGREDLIAGERQLAAYAGQAIVQGQVAGLLGWTPSDQLARLSQRLAGVGAVAVALPRPKGVDPPTAAAQGSVAQTFSPLVTTYATVPYGDVDPTLPAGLAYVVMFGAMFGDVGHGLLLALVGLAIRFGLSWPRAVVKLRQHWMFITAAGISAAVFGLGYGEFFGPTGVVPIWWIAPMEQPVQLLLGGVALGVVLLACAYALGTVNRVREGGWAAAIYAPSGLAGSLVFLAAGLCVPAWFTRSAPLAVIAGFLALVALVVSFAGFRASAGGGGAGAMQAVIEVFDMVLRLGSNVVSFARLAAFGLTHAVLGWIIWNATTGLWAAGPARAVVAVVVFVVGNVLAFALEALVAAVQALRLEYYELFSRVFDATGRPFRPWHVPADISEGE